MLAHIDFVSYYHKPIINKELKKKLTSLRCPATITEPHCSSRLYKLIIQHGETSDIWKPRDNETSICTWHYSVILQDYSPSATSRSGANPHQSTDMFITELVQAATWILISTVRKFSPTNLTPLQKHKRIFTSIDTIKRNAL